jgi:hypothetical protein
VRGIMEDPRIAQVAKICHDEMLAEIGKRMANGEDFFHARECVMAERGNEIARTYGKKVATRAMQRLTALAPSDMPWEVIAAQDRFIADKALEAADFTNGGKHYWSPIQKWHRENSPLLDRLMCVAIGMIAVSPLTGTVAAIWSWSTAEFFPAMGWSTGLGVAIMVAMFVFEQVIGTRPKRARDTAPRTPEELEQQREVIRARWNDEAMKRLVAEAEAEAASKREQQDQRDEAQRLKRIADGLEIAAQQERRRLGTELPSDPVHVPPRPPRKKSKAAIRRENEISFAEHENERRNGVSRPGAQGYVPPRSKSPRATQD